MTRRVVVLELAQLEAAHLTDLVDQFLDLLAATGGPGEPEDPAVARLVPDAYADDDEAASEFRDITQDDLLKRRRADAAAVLHSLRVEGHPLEVAELDESAATTAMLVRLDGDQVSAWLRTLTALRLVLASRLDIRHEADHDPEDPRFGVYNWLGFRLEGLLQALED
jgi:hypothetical protein